MSDFTIRHPLRALTLIGLCVMVAACEEPPSASPVPQAGARWYDAEQVQQGSTVFLQHCATCHGEQAQGLVADWRQKLDDGFFPPPPLNGTAHAWHHPRSVLLQVINEGGLEFGGRMPAFGAVLTETDKLAAIAYFQNFWDDEIYANWQQMGGSN